ncbi:MAG: hypothetical protein KKE23_03975 [Nanoarchaeota archaeon]|nr:hypothetical protein [Nanoarchaeota archaeon]
MVNLSKSFVIIAICLSLILISGAGGCGAGGLPVATSDETYTHTIAVEGGTAPHNCTLVGATSIGGTLNLADNCVISGTAPTATDKKIIPFKVEITDANGNSKVEEMHLIVEPRPISFELPEKIKSGSVGGSYSYNLKSDENPKYGNPPYTFTVKGQPIGLIMGLDGVLSGKIPEGATVKGYDLEVCVKDLSGNSACANTVLKVDKKTNIKFNEELAKLVAGNWAGSFVASKKQCVSSCRTYTDTGEFRFTIDVTDDWFSNLDGSGTGTSKYLKEGTGYTCPEHSFDYSFTIPDNYGKYIKGPYNTYTGEWGSSPITSIDLDFNFPAESRFGDYKYSNEDCTGGDWTSQAYLTWGHGYVSFYLNESNILGLIEEGNTVAIEEILKEGFEYKREYGMDSSVYSTEISIRKVD